MSSRVAEAQLLTASVTGSSGHVCSCTNVCSKCLELNIFVRLGGCRSKRWFHTVLEAARCSSSSQHAQALGRAAYGASGLCPHAVEGAWQLCGVVHEGANVIHNQVISHCLMLGIRISTYELGDGQGEGDRHFPTAALAISKREFMKRLHDLQSGNPLFF